MMIATKRLTIRPYEMSDESDVYKVINDQQIYETTLNIPFPYPRDQVGIWMHFTLKNSEYRKGYEWGVFEKKQYIGNVGIVNIDRVNNSGEITYFIGSGHMGKGYATEAIAAVLDYSFKTLRLERIQGRCMIHNKASRRVMEKCGFLFEGTSRHEVVKAGKYIDVDHLAILYGDYLNSSL